MPKTGVPTAFNDDSTNIFYAVEFAFDSGIVRLWTGYGSITIEGDTYYGLGKCLGISSIEETSQMAVTGISIAVSGIAGTETGDSDLITEALNEPVQGRRVICYLGTLNNQRVSSHYQIFEGLVNTLQVSDSGETSTISIRCDSRFAEFMRSSTIRYTDVEQGIYGGDGDDVLEDVAPLQTKKIDWV